MTAAFTPALALAYVRELSADLRDGIVLDREGTTLAGNAALAAPARALLEHGTEGATAAGKAFAIRGAHHSIVVVTGPFALPRVTRRDLRAALAALESASAQETPPTPVLDALVSALIDAPVEPFPRHSAVSRSD